MKGSAHSSSDRYRTLRPGFPFWPSRSASLYTQRRARERNIFMTVLRGARDWYRVHVSERTATNLTPATSADTSLGTGRAQIRCSIGLNSRRVR